MCIRDRLYIWGVILVGIILGPFAVYRYITGLGQVDFSLEIQQMVCLIALCALCRSQPIYINSHHAIDVSVIGILSTCLLYTSMCIRDRGYAPSFSRSDQFG